MGGMKRPNFLLAYHGGKTPETSDDVAAEMARWKAWFDNISAAVIDPGNPVGMSKTVTNNGVIDDGGPNPVSGYTVISADNIDDAVAMAKACPILDSGSIEVAEIHDVSM